MRLIERQGTGHAYVHLDGDVVANATGAKVVHFTHALLLIGDPHDLVLLRLGQAGVGKFLHRLHHQCPSGLDDEGAHHDGGKRIEHGPALTQQDGATYAHHGADARQGVAPMVPGIGHHGLRMILATDAHRELVGPLFQGDARYGGNQGHHAWLLQLHATDGLIGLDHARIANHQTHHQERQSDDGRGQRLVLAVPVIVVLVLRFTSQLHKHQHHHIGCEIGERMDGVGDHGRRMA